ncbi:MAG TPA: hypothetical protein VHW45_00735 [Candidatus Sulfotelmatobacter sp.]|jgi:TPR repeat protein|nr:hypothetical protein [Candidatus Sulfotelmatobacter sp.]
MVEVGFRQIHGITVPRDVPKGGQWIRESAERSDPIGLIYLSVILDRGELIMAATEDRRRWRSRAGLNDEIGLRVQGCYLYSESLSAPTMPVRRQRLTVAKSLLLESAQRGDLVGLAYLAYLSRQIGDRDNMRIHDLLKVAATSGVPLIIVNRAVALATGCACAQNWDEADRLFALLPSTLGIAEWWSAAALDGDPEGDLVLAWLCRHGFAADPDRKSFAERIQRVEGHFGPLPAWLKGE